MGGVLMADGCCWWPCTTARTPPCGISPRCSASPRATVCWVIQRLGPLLVVEPARVRADAADRLWIVDGTLVPVRDRKIGASSRNCRFSANVQVIVGAEPRLVVAAVPPGARHHGRRERLAGLRTGRPLRRCDGPRRRRLHLHRADRPAPQTSRTAATERRGRGQRAASQDPSPRPAGRCGSGAHVVGQRSSRVGHACDHHAGSRKSRSGARRWSKRVLSGTHSSG